MFCFWPGVVEYVVSGKRCVPRGGMGEPYGCGISPGAPVVPGSLLIFSTELRFQEEAAESPLLPPHWEDSVWDAGLSTQPSTPSLTSYLYVSGMTLTYSLRTQHRNDSVILFFIKRSDMTSSPKHFPTVANVCGRKPKQQTLFFGVLDEFV